MGEAELQTRVLEKIASQAMCHCSLTPNTLGAVGGGLMELYVEQI